MDTPGGVKRDLRGENVSFENFESIRMMATHNNGMWGAVVEAGAGVNIGFPKRFRDLILSEILSLTSLQSLILLGNTILAYIDSTLLLDLAWSLRCLFVKVEICRNAHMVLIYKNCNVLRFIMHTVAQIIKIRT